ncbi:ABC transporter permease [Negadavirga shengliensis]|uniref:ABC transporter permease n=1 Tax=Negadavirga shengliensis TaxID=1389218 RepID=A0ABV9SWG8_9BACT
MAIGMAACFLILQYVRFERSYDRFHENADRIYRVILERDQDLSAANHPGVGPALKADFPEVEEYARMAHQSIHLGDNVAVSYEDEQGNIKMFNEDRVYNVDPSFLTLFSFPFVYGDTENALSDASLIVISESISRKFFGSENPMGKTLHLLGRFPFTVNGVFQDVPENSHIQFDILIASWAYRNEGDYNKEGSWKWPEFYTYVKLDPLADPQQLEAKFPEFMQKYLGERMKEMNNEERLHLQGISIPGQQTQ